MRALGQVALLSILLSVTAAGCCADEFYEETSVGRLAGRGWLEWLGPNSFLFTVDPSDPLRFERPGKPTITLDTMYTTGGSTPHWLWSLRNYSPWWYGPAYLVHDWIFLAHACGSNDYTLEEAAVVLAEAMKTLMTKHPGLEPNAFVLYSVYRAVQSPIARRIWDEMKCTTPPEAVDAGMAQVMRAAGAPRVVQVLDFTSPRR